MYFDINPKNLRSDSKKEDSELLQMKSRTRCTSLPWVKVLLWDLLGFLSWTRPQALKIYRPPYSFLKGNQRFKGFFLPYFIDL